MCIHMPLKKEEVAAIGHLARLTLTDEELERFGPQLDAILGYVASLNKLDLAGAAPTTHVQEATDRLRADTVQPGISPEDVAANAPDFKAGSVRVPRILED